MDSLRGLNVFVLVAEQGSFVSVGRQLGISASAIGKQITRLETELGVRLFHRNTRNVTLTVEGVLFLARSQNILEQIKTAKQEISSNSLQPQGRLKISMPRISNLFLPLLGDFSVRYPAIELDLDFSDRMVDVVREGFDVVIRTGTPVDSRLSMRWLASFRSLVVASPAYFETQGMPVHPNDLALHRCLHYRFPSTGKLEQWVLQDDTVEIKQPPVTMVCNNIEARVSFATQGLGIAYLPEFAVKQSLEEGRLLRVLDKYLDPANITSFYILWPSNQQLANRVRAFIDFMSDCFADPKLILAKTNVPE